MKRNLLSLLAPLVGVSALITFILYGSTPDRIGPVGVTAFFMAVYVWCWLAIALFLRLVTPVSKLRSFREASYFSYISLLAAIPTILLALSSIDQLGLRDFLIIGALSSLLIFYWSRHG